MRYIFSDFQKRQTTKTATGEVAFNEAGIAPVTDEQAATFLSISGYREVKEDGSELTSAPEKQKPAPAGKPDATPPAAPPAGSPEGVGATGSSRKELFAKAKDLGIKFAGNAKTADVAELIAAKEKELADTRVEPGEGVETAGAMEASKVEEGVSLEATNQTNS